MTGQSNQFWQGTSDEILAKQIQAGDQAAFEELARRYLRPIYAVVSSFLSEEPDVEDAVQETFIKFLDTIDRFDPERTLAPWLYQIARNIARNHNKARLRHSAMPVSELELAAGEAGPDAALDEHTIRTFLSSAIDALPEQRRTAFRLTDVEGFSVEETATIMGLTPGTVRSHVHHARRILRQALSARGFEPTSTT